MAILLNIVKHIIAERVDQYCIVLNRNSYSQLKYGAYFTAAGLMCLWECILYYITLY